MTANKSYILLGEGDFTYSLDLCRYMASTFPTGAKNEGDAATSPSDHDGPVETTFSITCTGVDTLQELRDKYKDIDFVLRNIRSCSTQEGSDGITGGTKLSNNDGGLHQNNIASQLKQRVNTKILHGINAVEANCNISIESSNEHNNAATTRSYDHVLFQHPHLGTEDAQLHSRFLRHLFYAASKRWMNPDVGLLHLTLVNGQCARWKCIEGAEKHGLVLLRRGEFRVPPPPVQNNTEGGSTAAAEDGGGKTYYRLRRHQSGRSFANRRRMQQQYGESAHRGQSNDSETLVFGRACDYPKKSACVDADHDDADHDIGLLPWECASRKNTADIENDDNKMESKPINSNPEPSPNADNTNPFPCKYCPKSFQEQRSLKNHIMSSHPDCDEVRMWMMKRGKKKNKKRKLSGDGKMECNNVTDDGDMTNTNRIDVKDPNSTAHLNDTELQGPPWVCTICESSQHDGREKAPARVFPHKQALLDHKRAKHFGVHLDIKPDWHHGDVGDTATNNSNASNGSGTSACEGGSSPSGKEAPAVIGSCSVCNHPYTSKMDEYHHEMEFLPTSSAVAKDMARAILNNGIVRFDSNNTVVSPIYKCRHCSKSFRELRAQRQHENFCIIR